MQRRAAAAYTAIFVLLAAGSYGVIATAQQPHVDLADSEVDQQATQGGTFEVEGTTYTVEEISEASAGGGGHGGGGESTVQGKITWNATVEQTEELSNGSVVEFQDANWTVTVPAEEDPSTFRLVENFTLDKPTVTQDGTTYVVLEGEGDGNRTLVPKDRYMQQRFGEPRTMEFSEGDTWNGTKTVSNVTSERALLTWETEETQETTVTEGANVTLGGTTFTAHFPDTSQMQLTQNHQAYQQESEEIDRFHERKNGLWFLSILGGIGAVMLLALAYMPNKGD
jgi:hypothetical protein